MEIHSRYLRGSKDWAYWIYVEQCALHQGPPWSVLDLPPIDTYLKAMALGAMNRPRRCGQWKDYTGWNSRHEVRLTLRTVKWTGQGHSRNEIAHRPHHKVTTYTPLYSGHRIQERVGEEWLPNSLECHLLLHRWLEAWWESGRHFSYSLLGRKWKGIFLYKTTLIFTKQKLWRL